jgi:hypothetical protein
MKPSLIVIAAVSILLAGALASTRLFTASASSSPSAAADPKPCAADDRSTVFGHVASLTPLGDRFRLRFDPAWYLSGETANQAAAEDGAVEAGAPVPNDHYVVEEGHRALTYLVPTTAHVTVLTNGGTIDASGFASSEISVSQLAQLVAGEEPVKLFEGLSTGFWLRGNGDTVCSLEQQYHP